MFFPAMQLFTVPPCNLKYLHLPDINIKHPGRGATPLLVMARAVDHVSVWWEWKQMKGWEATLAMAKSSHMPVVYEHAYLFKGFP